MRAIYLTSLFCILCLTVAAQNVAINTNAAPPDASAILDVQSTNKGVAFPRMLESERTAIVAPVKGLVVYQTDGADGYYYNSGTDLVPVWVKLAADQTKVAFAAVYSLNPQQSFNPGAYLKVQFNAEEYDESSNFVPGATSEFTCPSPGIYHFSASVAIQGSQGSRYDIAFFVNGIQKKNVLMTSTTGLLSIPISTDLKLAVNDKVDVRVAASNSSGFIVGASQQWVFFSGHKVN